MPALSAIIGRVVCLLGKLRALCPRLPEKLLDQVREVGGQDGSRVLQSRVVQQDASSHSHHPEAVAGETSPQTSVASLSLEQLTDAVGAQVIQESRSQVTTTYFSRDDGGAGTMSSFYQAEADVPPVELAPRQAQRCQFPPPMVVSAAHVCSWEVGFVLS